MTLLPKTRPSILVRLCDPSDAQAWSTFESIYRPAIVRIAELRGLQEADAQDIAQVVMLRVSDKISAFRPDASRARFRTWLARIAHNAITDQQRRHRRRPEHSVDGEMPDRETVGVGAIDACESLEETWEREYRRELFRWAAARIEPEFSIVAWDSFWRTAVLGHPAETVARELGRTVGSVYTNRSRIMKRLRETIGSFDETLDFKT